MGAAPKTTGLGDGARVSAGDSASPGDLPSSPPTPAPGPATAAKPSRPDLLALVGLLVALALLWGRGFRAWYWIDEGLSLGISSHPLTEMRDLLAQDTSPPLYHVLLAGWIRVFGSSEPATHALSLLFALATVPAALWAGWSLFDRRAGWMTAGLAAVSPFLAIYATETRMYSLVALLSVLTTASFLHAFVFRRRRFLPAFAVFTALLLYTHYWAAFFALGAAAAVAICMAHEHDRRPLFKDAVLAFGGAALLFAPWVPTLLYQRAHSAVGWAAAPNVVTVRDDVVGLVGGPAAAVALALCAGTALVALLRRPWGRTSLVVLVTLAIAVIVVGIGWTNSRASFQWHSRYLGVLIGPLLIPLGLALARAGDLAVAVLVIVGVLSGPFAVPTARDAKSNAAGWVDEASDVLGRGDVVFAAISDIPLLAHYLPDGLRYATTTGPVDDPLAADWRDVVERFGRTDHVAALSPLVDTLPVGGNVVVTCPTAEEADLVGWPTFIQLEIRRCREAAHHLVGRSDLRLERAFPHPPRAGSPHETRLLTKVAAPAS